MRSVAIRAIAGIMVGCSLLTGCGTSSTSSPTSTDSCAEFKSTADELLAARKKNANVQTVLALAYFYVNDKSGCATAKDKAQAQADITAWSENK